MKRALVIGVAALLALVAAFAAGRYSAPVRTKIETKVETQTVTVTEWRDREVVRRVAGPVTVRTVTIEKPGGERVVERIVERGTVTTEKASEASSASSASTASVSASETVTETARPGWAGGVAATWDPGHLEVLPDRLGVELDRRLAGTVWLGARASVSTTLDAPQVGLALRMEW